jgi:hypothetical protein
MNSPGERERATGIRWNLYRIDAVIRYREMNLILAEFHGYVPTLSREPALQVLSSQA